jgi:hypothetical protein
VRRIQVRRIQVRRIQVRRIQPYLRDLPGLRVSVGEVGALLHRVAAHGAPTHGAPTLEQIRARVGRRAVVHADETGWREAGRNGSVWGLLTPVGERSFADEPSRAGASSNDLLGEAFTGVLVTDFSGGSTDPPRRAAPALLGPSVARGACAGRGRLSGA